MVLCAPVLMADAAGDTGATFAFLIPYTLFCLGTLIPSLAVTFRRLHDIDKPAAWCLIVLIPFVGPSCC